MSNGMAEKVVDGSTGHTSHTILFPFANAWPQTVLGGLLGQKSIFPKDPIPNMVCGIKREYSQSWESIKSEKWSIIQGWKHAFTWGWERAAERLSWRAAEGSARGLWPHWRKRWHQKICWEDREEELPTVVQAGTSGREPGKTRSALFSQKNIVVTKPSPKCCRPRKSGNN